jgi:hyperosmotically inducible periplasmic protein
MKTDVKIHLNRILSIVTAGALALGLAACDQKPKTDDARTFEKLVENAGRDREAAAPPAAADTMKSDRPRGAGADAAVEARVKAALSAEPGLRALTVDVKSTDGVVTLYGTADSPTKSHEAALVAMNVEGVRSVKNEMVVVRGS